MVGGEGLGQAMSIDLRSRGWGGPQPAYPYEPSRAGQEDGVYIVICKTQDYNGVFAMREEPSGGNCASSLIVVEVMRRLAAHL